MENSNNIIMLPALSSDGTTGLQFIEKMKNAKLTIGGYAQRILQSDDFAKTITQETKYLPGIIKGEMFADNERTNTNIRKYAIEQGAIKPTAELSLMLRLKYSNKALKKLGLKYLIPMHKPIKTHNKKSYFLGLDTTDTDYDLRAFSSIPSFRWIEAKTGFVFLFPNLSSG